MTHVDAEDVVDVVFVVIVVDIKVLVVRVEVLLVDVGFDVVLLGVRLVMLVVLDIVGFELVPVTLVELVLSVEILLDVLVRDDELVLSVRFLNA